MRSSTSAIVFTFMIAAALPGLAAQPDRAPTREDPAWVAADRDKQIVYTVAGMDKVVARRNVTYHTLDDTALRMDVYHPPDLGPRERRPLVVFVHGGPLPANLLTEPKDWGEFRSFAALLAASGFVSVTFNHRYYGDMNALPAAQSDVLAVLEHLRSHADSLHIDPDRITLFAFSGSGLLLSHFLRERPAYLRALVLYYAGLDLGVLDRARPGRIEASVLRAFDPLGILAQHGSAAAPLLVVRAGLDRPDINEPMNRFVQLALAHNAPIEFINYAQGQHGFDIADDTERSREIIRRTVEFVRERSRG